MTGYVDPSRENLQAFKDLPRDRPIHMLNLVRFKDRATYPDDHPLADEALLTGESTPVVRGAGSAVTAGSYNLQAAVLVRVQGVGADTRFGQIVALMESASLQKPRLAQLADRVARPFLVLVLLAAALAALWWWSTDPSRALMVAVSVLIVTCPCALSLATPVAMLSAAGALARQGVLVRNLHGLEALASVDAVVFDKTGTLTRDGMAVRGVHVAEGMAAPQALAMAAALARQSLHPVSRALVAADTVGGAGQWQVEDLKEEAGLGLSALVRRAEGAGPARRLLLGSARHAGVVAGESAAVQQVFLSWQNDDGTTEAVAHFDLSEDLRPEAAVVIQALRQIGVEVHLLSGDRAPAAARVAEQAGIEHWRGDCTPQEKLQVLQGLQAQGRRVAMVGDGLNDGPVLAGAHVSFAFGRSVPLAQSRSDLVVLGDDLSLIARGITLARRTLRVVRQNLWCLTSWRLHRGHSLSLDSLVSGPGAAGSAGPVVGGLPWPIRERGTRR